VERNPEEQGLVADGTGVGGAPAQCLTIVLAGAADVGIGDVGEPDQLHAVDLYFDPPDPVAPADLRVRAPPESEGHPDVTRSDVVEELPAEFHQLTLGATPVEK